MKKNILIIISFFIISCSSSKIKKDFSDNAIIYSNIEVSSNDSVSMKEAIKKGKEESLKEISKIFNVKDLKNNSDFFAYSKIKEVQKNDTGFLVKIKNNFRINKFIKYLNNNQKEPKPEILISASFLSSLVDSSDDFFSWQKNKCEDLFCFNISSYTLSFNDKIPYDYYAQCEVYTYPLNGSLALGTNLFPVISSSTIKVYYVIEKKQISNFSIQETASLSSIDLSTKKSLISLGENIKNKIYDVVLKDYKQRKNMILIISNVETLNDLSKIKESLANSFPSIILKKYYDEEVYFSFLQESKSPEEIASEILKNSSLPLNIEYISKDEIKFSLGKNIISNEKQI